jgi:serine/threonine protein phosphatase PrpC
MTRYLAYAAFTHHGKGSPHNQDAILVAGQVMQKAAFVSGCVPLMAMPRFAISDGVGGSPQPAAASRRLLQNLLALDASHPALTPRARAERLHDRLMQALNRQPLLEDAAATLITVEWSDNGLRLWHAGDSRGYRIRQGQAQRLTQDHTAIHMLQSEGWLDPAETEALGNTRLANALDNLFVYSHYAEPPTVSVQSLQLPPGEVLLLVSDGVTAELNDGEIADCINAADLTGSAKNLFDAVMAKGAGDDFSAILIAHESAAT